MASLCLGLCLCLAGPITAAPPEVTSLFPAGAARGSSVSVTIQGKQGDGRVGAWTSRRGLNVTVPEKPGPLTISIEPTVEPGIAWLRLFNEEGASALRPFVVGSLPEINEVEPNDERSKAQPFPTSPASSTVSVVVNGQHQKGGDVDMFAVPMTGGQTCVASLLANRVLGSPSDPHLQIVGPDGFVLELNEDDWGLDPQLAFTAPADGTYFVRTWALPAQPDSSIRLFGSPACVYRLTITTDSFVDQTLPLAVQAGVNQPVVPLGWGLKGQPAGGATSVETPVSALGLAFAWPSVSQPHRLSTSLLAVPHSSVMEQEPNDLMAAQPVEFPCSVTGQIGSARDVDTFRFVGKKGSRWRFEVQAREVGSPLDPVLRFYDAAGKMLREADDDGRESADPDIEFTLPADGEHRVTVTDRFGLSGDRFVYLLNVTEPSTDFALSVAADSFVLKPGKELEIPVTVTRRSGFAAEISLVIEGLPTGVTFDDKAKSEPKGDSAKTVKLKLNTAEGAVQFSGPIRIVGRSTGDRVLERTAVVSLKPFSAERSDLWLTVSPAGK